MISSLLLGLLWVLEKEGSFRLDLDSSIVLWNSGNPEGNSKLRSISSFSIIFNQKRSFQISNGFQLKKHSTNQPHKLSNEPTHLVKEPTDSSLMISLSLFYLLTFHFYFEFKFVSLYFLLDSSIILKNSSLFFVNSP